MDFKTMPAKFATVVIFLIVVAPQIVVTKPKSVINIVQPTAQYEEYNLSSSVEAKQDSIKRCKPPPALCDDDRDCCPGSECFFDPSIGTGFACLPRGVL